MNRDQRRNSMGFHFRYGHFLLAVCVACFLPLMGRSMSPEHQAPSPAVPSATAASPSKTYKLQPGDTISVFYRLTPEYDQSLTILPDGNVNLRLVGSVHVAGLEVDQARQAIFAEASTLLKDPQISVSVTEFVRDQFTVMGEVGKPGRYELHGSTSLVDALALASGFTTTSAQRKVVLVRPLSPNSEYGSATIFDFKHLTRLNASTPVPVIQNGDIIIVTTSKFAKVSAVIKLINVGLYANPLPTV